MDGCFTGPNLKISFPFWYTTKSPADIASGAVAKGLGDFSETGTKLLEIVSGAFQGIAASVCDGINGRRLRTTDRSAPDQPSIKPRQNESAITDTMRQKNQNAANRERRR